MLSHIPIIIITAKSGGKERVCGLEVGADAYLEKPFNAEELNIRITKFLEQRRLLREKYSKAMREGTELNVKLNPADQDFLAHLNDYIYALMSNHGLNSDMVADKMCMSQIPIESQGPCHHGLQHFCLYPADAHGEEQTPLGLYRGTDRRHRP